jgi:CRISPR system Cascade subunit CasB
MAALRHSLSFELGEDPRVYSYVERFTGIGTRVDAPRRLALYAVAGLFAHHSTIASQSFASAFGELAARRESASIEQRFIALLEADAESVVIHLRHALSLLVSEEIGFDYATLLDDLSLLLGHWNDDQAVSKVKQTWARDYYQSALAEGGIDSDPAAFVAYLEKLVTQRDRSSLATLRRSLSFAPGDLPAAYPIVEPFVAPGWSIRDSRRCARYLVAGIVALNPRVSEHQSFAAALGRVAHQRESGNIEGRFIALLGADAENVADYLRHSARLMASTEVAFNPARLLTDLSTWLNPRVDPAWLDRIRQRWARDFYQPTQTKSHPESQETPTKEA